MVEHGVKIDDCTQKMNDIHANTCKELEEEMDKLYHRKQSELEFMEEEKNNEMQSATQRYEHQMQHINQQRTEKLSNFKHYCVKQLRKMKKEIEKNNEAIDINFDEIYNKWYKKNSKEVYNKQRVTRHSRTRSKSNMNRVRFPPPKCLVDDDIENDLEYLLNKAREQNIDIPQDTFLPAKRSKARKYKIGVSVNDEDRLQIEDICNKVGINLVNKQLNVALYGYKDHLDVYQAIFDWIHNYNVAQQSDCIKQLKSGKLRDLQVKLASVGTVGRKNEMANGIRIKLKELTVKYKDANCIQT